jgi:hypothetical protein
VDRECELRRAFPSTSYVVRELLVSPPEELDEPTLDSAFHSSRVQCCHRTTRSGPRLLASAREPVLEPWRLPPHRLVSYRLDTQHLLWSPAGEAVFNDVVSITAAPRAGARLRRLRSKLQPLALPPGDRFPPIRLPRRPWLPQDNLEPWLTVKGRRRPVHATTTSCAAGPEGPMRGGRCGSFAEAFGT